MDELIKYIKENYNPRHCGFTSQRSFGNADDVFEDGVNCGTSSTLWEIGCMLGLELKTPEEQVWD